MTVQFAHAFLDLFWLTQTWNLGLTSNTDSRTKNEAPSKSMVVYGAGDGMEWSRSRCNEKSAFENMKNSFYLGWARYADRYKDQTLYNCVIQTRMHA